MSDTKHRLPIRLTQAVIAGNSVPVADARDLHAFLDVGRDFTNWIKARIKHYGFEQARDFITESDPPKRANQNGGDRRSANYLITLDMAKELAMVERNERGKEARRYFIECERRAQAVFGATSVREPAFRNKTLEEIRCDLSVVNAYRHNLGVPAAAWMMREIGFPMPPAHLLPAWQQQELDLRQRAVDGALTIIVPNGRRH